MCATGFASAGDAEGFNKANVETTCMSPAELWSHFLPNYRCRDLGGEIGGFAELLRISEGIPTDAVRAPGRFARRERESNRS
ncbi:MAG: hypothetical protein N2C14_17120 [Planctomycetales bacterium]